jgi:molybdenum cofactor biosynthesis protein B
VAGVANRTLIFAMPGSTKACRTAWDNIIAAAGCPHPSV